MSDDLRAELRHVFEQWFESIPARDASFVDRSMDPGFRGIDADGVLRDFAAYKALYDALPPGCAVEHDIQEFDVRALGEGAAAMVTGRYRARIELGGAVLVDKAVHFVSVWERAPDGWKGLLHQVTALPAGGAS